MIHRLVLLLIGCLLLISVSFAQDSARLAPITPENVQNLTELASLSRGGFRELVWSPSGDQWILLTASETWWYDRRTVEPIALSQGLKIHTAVFSPDERWLVTAECEVWFCPGGETLRLWRLDGDRPQQIHELRSSGLYSGTFGFSPDGGWFIHEADMEINVYQTTTLDRLSPTWQIENRDNAVDVRFSLNSQYMAIINQRSMALSPMLRMFDLQTQRELYQFELFGSGWYKLQFSSDDRYLITTSNSYIEEEQEFPVWTAEDGREVTRFKANAVSVHPNGDLIAVSHRGQVMIYALADLQLIDMIPVDYAYYLPTGHLLIEDQSDGLALFQSDGTQIPLETGPDQWEFIAPPGTSPDGRYLFTRFKNKDNWPEYRVMIWDQHGKLIKSVSHNTYLSLAFDPQNTDYLAIGEANTQRLTLWHLPTLTPQSLFDDVFDPGQVLGFVPDQGWVITLTEHDGSRLWQIETNGLRLARMMRDTQPLAVSASGWIALVDQANLILRDLKEQAADRVFSVDAPCETVSFSADERYLGCVNATQGTIIWSLAHGEGYSRFHQREPWNFAINKRS